MEALLEAGADPDAPDGESGWAPLHRALHWGQLRCAAALLRANASLTALDWRGRTPLDLLSAELKEYVEPGGDGDVFAWGEPSAQRVLLWFRCIVVVALVPGCLVPEGGRVSGPLGACTLRMSGAAAGPARPARNAIEMAYSLPRACRQRQQLHAGHGVHRRAAAPSARGVFA